MKTVRTMLYGDCDFEEWELELLHTPIMQRLYNLKQLGFTDKVYPDAIHSRFNHTLGVASRAQGIIEGVLKSLKRETEGHSPARRAIEIQGNEHTIERVIEYVNSRTQVIRLVALLHDITHIPYGHTLEDELNIFKIKHDDPDRQADFFNILTVEFLFAIMLRHDPNIDFSLLTIVRKNKLEKAEKDKLSLNFKTTLERIEQCYGDQLLIKVKHFLVDLETAMIALFYLDDLHKPSVEADSLKSRADAIGKLFISDILVDCGIERPSEKPEFNLAKDAFVLDIIGNTICADLLDYAKRDPQQSGLHYDYDERIFKYFSLVGYSTKGSNGNFLRLCLQVFTNKLRHDVVSEIVTILRTRYLLSERVIFHPTKCAAGAMLGSAVYMMGIDKAELDFFRIGDAVFLYLINSHVLLLMKIADDLRTTLIGEDKEMIKIVNEIITVGFQSDESYMSALSKVSSSFNASHHQIDMAKAMRKICEEERSNVAHEQDFFSTDKQIESILETVCTRLSAANRLVWQIQGRQFYDMIFRISKLGSTPSAPVMAKLAKRFKDAQQRFNLERQIEEKANLPYGSLIAHCPKFDTTLKGADVLVFGSDPSNAIKFSEIDDKHELNTLRPFKEEADSLQGAYECIWNMYFYLQEALMHKWPLVEKTIQNVLTEIAKAEILNSQDLHQQLEADFFDVAKIHLDVIRYMREESEFEVKYTPDFADYLESKRPRGKSKEMSPEALVNQWVNLRQGRRPKKE